MSEGRNLVGVDIGSDSIKVCEVTEGRKGTRVMRRFGIHSLQPQTVVDGHIMNAGAVVEGLQKLFHKSRRRDVAVRLSGHGVIIKKIALPLMSNAELSEQINWEAEQHIPFDLTEVQLDYDVLERHEDRGQMEVLLVAAKKDEVNDLTQLLTEAKLKPRVVDLDAFAVQNCFEAAYGPPPAIETIVLLHVGASVTTINILSNGLTSFTRDITNGGNAVTEELQRALDIDRTQADQLKCQNGDGQAIPPQADKIIRQSMEELAGEVQRSLDFFLATTSTQTIHRIYTSGGTANSPILASAIERRARVPVSLIDPLRAAVPDPKRLDLIALQGRTAQAVVACGLALRKERERRV